MASTAPPTAATDDDGDHRNMNSTTISAAENSEGRTNTTSTTMAIQQQKNDKRSRRVSFAEMTSVHFFDRDDYNETPSDGSSKSNNSDDGGDGLGFRKLDDSRDDEQGEGDNKGDEGSEEDDDDDEDDVRRSFFRPIESPSPGSNIGSATSNDEDNFFGPVSASFIRPGRLSDSAASDENHDITMDSTAFSMHFRSLARSDSGVDLKTPTGVHLSFEEKTPTHSTLGSSMVLTVARKPICQSAVPVTNVSGSSDSSDMSLVGENSRRYDYERLPPELDELLAEGKKNLHVVSGSGNISAPKSPRITESKFLQSMEEGNGLMESKFLQSMEQGNGVMELSINQKQESGTYLLSDMLTDQFPQKKLDDANGDPIASAICHADDLFASSILDTPASNLSLDNLTGSPNQDKSVRKSKKSVGEPSKLYNSDEFSALNHGALQNLDNKLGPFHGNMQHECESPLQELRSYSPAKQNNTILGTVTPSKYSLMVTPPQEQNIKHHGSESSILKSISKLEKLQASAISSYLNAKINNSCIQSLEPSKTPRSNNLLERNSNNLQTNEVSDSPVHIEKQLLSAYKGEDRSINISDNGIEAPKYSQDIDHTVESLNSVETGTCRTEQSMKLRPSTASPSPINFSGKRRNSNQFASKDHIDKSPVTFGIDSLSAEIILGNIGEKKVIDTLPSFVSSPDKRLENKSSSPEIRGRLSKELFLNDGHLKCFTFSRGQDSASKGSVVEANLMNATAGNSGAVLLGRTEQVSSPVIELNGTEGFTGVDRAFDGEDIHHEWQDLFGSAERLRSLLRHEESQVVHPMSLDGNPRSGISLSRSRSNLSGGESGAVVYSHASLSARSNLHDSRLQKNLLECFEQSPSRKEPHESKNSVSFHPSITEDLVSPKSVQLMDKFRNSSTRKRRNEDVVIRDREHRDEDILIQRTPKLQKVGGHDAETLECPKEVCRGAPKWADIYSKILEDAQRLLSPGVDTLNLHSIDVMDDILSQQQRSKTYRVLCDGLLPQRTSAVCDSHGRIVETRLLLHRIMYEKAKSQLMRVKRGKLEEKIQQLSSGLQESRMLKSSSLLQKTVKFPTVAPADAVCLQSLSVKNKDAKEVSCDKVTTMVQCLEASDRKISNLIKTLHLSCKIKGEHSCPDTIVLVNDYLMKRTCCRFIRMDMQMWVVHKLESRNGHHILVLNYLGFIIQRLAVTVGPVSSIVITNKLNDVDISKKFPNMDACTAFGFVLNTEITRNYVGVRSLAQETQVTSSLLSNLLDVVEEVQLAQIELQNLTRTSFHSQSAEQLALQLCFFNFEIGRKVTLTLDISCLKRGVYPSEAFPSELAAADDVKKDSFPEQIVSEIRDAVKNLRAGYMRILRLCRCISHVVQASGG